MQNDVSKPEKDTVTVTNIGTAAVFYEWRKYQRPDFFVPKKSDGITRFYQHNPRGYLKPGESKTFTFLFRSSKQGIFTEEWDLLTDPLLVNPLPQVALTGCSMQADPYIPERKFLEERLEQEDHQFFASELLEDIVREVRTPTPPPPDMEDPETMREEFESRNVKYEVYYTPEIIQMYQDLHMRIKKELLKDNEEIPDWDFQINSLKELIKNIRSYEARQNSTDRFNQLLGLAKEKPMKRSLIYPFVYRLILEAIPNAIPEKVDSLRTELELEEFEFYVPEWTEEEKIQQRRTEILETWKAKQAKQKKGKTEEEIQELRQEFKQRLIQEAGQEWSLCVDKIYEQEAEINAQWHLKNIKDARDLPDVLFYTNKNNIMKKNSNIALNKVVNSQVRLINDDQLEEYSRILKLRTDCDIEGKKVFIRLDMDSYLKPVEFLKILPPEPEEDPKAKKKGKGKVGKQPPKKQEKEEEKRPPSKQDPKKAPVKEDKKQKEKEEQKKKAEEEKKKGQKAPPPAKGKKQEKEEAQIQEDTQPKEEDKAQYVQLPRGYSTEEPLQNALRTIKYCCDHLAKCVIICSHIYDKGNTNKDQISMKFIFDWLVTKVDNQVFFLESMNIENFDEMIEDYPDNSILIFENSRFNIFEFGFALDEQQKLLRCSFDKIMAFRKKLQTFCDIYVNEYLGDNAFMQIKQTVQGLMLRQNCSYLNPGTSSLLWTEYAELVPGVLNAVIGFGFDEDFMWTLQTLKKNENTLLIIGHNQYVEKDHQEHLTLLDKLILIYSLIYKVKGIYLAGEIADLFIKYQENLDMAEDYRIRLEKSAREREQQMLLLQQQMLQQQQQPQKGGKDKQKQQHQQEIQQQETKAPEYHVIKYEYLVIEILRVQKLSGTPLILPYDFTVAKKCEIPEKVEEEPENNENQQQQQETQPKQAEDPEAQDTSQIEQKKEKKPEIKYMEFTWGHYAQEIRVINKKIQDIQPNPENAEDQKDQEEDEEKPPPNKLVEEEEILDIGPESTQLLKQYLNQQNITSYIWINSLSQHRTDRRQLQQADSLLLDLTSEKLIKGILIGQDLKEKLQQLVIAKEEQAAEQKAIKLQMLQQEQSDFMSEKEASQSERGEEEGQEQKQSVVDAHAIQHPVTIISILQGRVIKGLEVLSRYDKPKPPAPEDDLSVLELI